MAKPLKFYDVRTRKSYKLTRYEIKVIKTKHGLRKQAIGEVNGEKVYRFV